MSRKARILCSFVLAAITLGQAGCMALAWGCGFGPANCEKSPTGGWRSFDFEIGEYKFGGDLTASKTLLLTFLPGVTGLVVNHNPYHLSIWRDKVNPDVHVSNVSLETIDGKVLFTSQGRAQVFEVEPEPGYHGIPVFAANPKWEGWYRRRSSRDGWSHSQPVDVPAFCDKLVLKLEIEERAPDTSEPETVSGEVLLRHYTRTWYTLLLKDIYLTTGGLEVRSGRCCR